VILKLVFGFGSFFLWEFVKVGVVLNGAEV